MDDSRYMKWYWSEATPEEKLLADTISEFGELFEDNMIIRSERELALFEETLDQCQNTIWLISSCGKQYDLMNPLERCLGIAEMLKYQSADEPEIFTTSYGDEMRLFEFIAAQKAV